MQQLINQFIEQTANLWINIFTSIKNKIKYIQGGSNMTGTDLCVNKPVTVPVIFEPPCIMDVTPTKNRTYYTEVTNNSFRSYSNYTNHVLNQYETYSVFQLQPRKNE